MHALPPSNVAGRALHRARATVVSAGSSINTGHVASSGMDASKSLGRRSDSSRDVLRKFAGSRQSQTGPGQTSPMKSTRKASAGASSRGTTPDNSVGVDRSETPPVMLSSALDETVFEAREALPVHPCWVSRLGWLEVMQDTSGLQNDALPPEAQRAMKTRQRAAIGGGVAAQTPRGSSVPGGPQEQTKLLEPQSPVSSKKSGYKGPPGSMTTGLLALTMAEIGGAEGPGDDAAMGAGGAVGDSGSNQTPDDGARGKHGKPRQQANSLILPLATFEHFTMARPDGMARWVDAVRLRAACTSAARAKAVSDFSTQWATQGAKVLGAVPETAVLQTTA